MRNNPYLLDSRIVEKKVGKTQEFSLSEKQIKIFTGIPWENHLEIKDLMTSLCNRQSRPSIQSSYCVPI